MELFQNTKSSTVSSFDLPVTPFETSFLSSPISCIPDKKVSSVVATQSWIDERVQSFCNILATRMGYLSSLKSIGNDWISGNAEAPSEQVIEVSKKILTSFMQYASTKKNTLLPKVVMGPMPIGGICIELHVDEMNAMYISLRNTEKTEIDIKYNDYYFSIESKTLDVSKKIVEKYESIIEI